MSGDKYYIDAIGKAVKVLRTINDNKGAMTQAEVSEETGLSPNNALRILHTLEKEGMVERVGNHYELGFRLALFRARYKAVLETRRDKIDSTLREMEERDAA